MEKLEATGAGGWNREKAEVTVEVFFGETLENETSMKLGDSLLILLQKSSFKGPPEVIDLLDVGLVDARGYWKPKVVSRLLFLFVVGVLKLREDCSGIGTSALLPALSF